MPYSPHACGDPSGGSEPGSGEIHPTNPISAKQRICAARISSMRATTYSRDMRARRARDHDIEVS